MLLTEEEMKIQLQNNYTDKVRRLIDLDRQLAEVEEKLKTPQRTVDDLILHMQLLKERNSLI